MDKKKLKILMIVDIVLIVGLVAVMMVLKGQYNEQAQKSVKEQEQAYNEIVVNFKIDLWKSIDLYSMSWKLLFETLNGDKTEKMFNDAVQRIQNDYEARIQQTGVVYDAVYMDNCLVKINMLRVIAGVELPSIDQQKNELKSNCFNLLNDDLKNAVREKGLADKFLLKSEGGVYEVACGKDCSISFTFAKGKLKSTDYKALAEYKLDDHFKLEAPAPFHFE